jgi:hypothetical protein
MEKQKPPREESRRFLFFREEGVEILSADALTDNVS